MCFDSMLSAKVRPRAMRWCFYDPFHAHGLGLRRLAPGAVHSGVYIPDLLCLLAQQDGVCGSWLGLAILRALSFLCTFLDRHMFKPFCHAF
jgi:hypothetical protein